jgi:hypothetical protein
MNNKMNMDEEGELVLSGKNGYRGIPRRKARQSREYRVLRRVATEVYRAVAPR